MIRSAPEVSEILIRLGLSAADCETLTANSQIMNFVPGQIVFRPGEVCRHFILPLCGRLEVVWVGRQGREIRLYAVEAGDLCIQSFQGLVVATPYSGEGRVVTAMTALILSSDALDAMMVRSQGFRRLLMAAVAQRLAALSQVIDGITGLPPSVRLAETLLRVSMDGKVSKSQAELAVDIASAREVVSRHLNEWARRGWVRLGRRRIEIVIPDALRHFVQTSM